MSGRVLVAGIGNVFLGDDGFGVEVVRRLGSGTASSGLPDGVDVVDYGIRGVHLAYDLLDDPPDTLVLVDAVPLDGPPGTLAVLEVPDRTAGDGPVPAVDGHGLHPDAVLRLLRGLGGSVRRVLVVGCAPAAVDPGMALSAPVAAAVDGAVRLVREVAGRAAEEARVPAG
ncbi:hydrogenase maturation protease [Geodermatophilus sp. YIM 151500]|uniref:hydrogenase maturation protease n=1 Tax=Geodermatophilus sp. YIM 151500 TaxID=2984531 RepID=UPI0021E4EF7C|nr:hydrogenase maturation protease [Geodermatophilus sp. YIM 151500]MCV2487925.1 hydrogenase maturation protease [Geodermatophilus sp. YIM 151500]